MGVSCAHARVCVRFVRFLKYIFLGNNIHTGVYVSFVCAVSNFNSLRAVYWTLVTLKKITFQSGHLYDVEHKTGGLRYMTLFTIIKLWHLV